MSGWNDPDFERIYKVSENKGGREGFVSIGNKIKDRQPTGKKYSEQDLFSIQTNFHNLMRYRCRNAEKCIQWLDENTNDLPKITNDLLIKTEPEWITVDFLTD